MTQPLSGESSNPDDIAANKRGYITDHQRAVFARLARNQRITAWLVVGAGLAYFGLIGYLIIVTWPPSLREGLGYLFIGLLLVPVGERMISSLRELRRLAQTQHELSTGLLVQTPGQVVWRARRYVAQIPGHTLYFAPPLNLPPGDYRFFYLPHSRWLLAAESFGRADPTQTIQPYLAVLARANHFSLDALAANRQGQLSAAQRKTQIHNLAFVALSLGLMSAFFGVLIFFVWRTYLAGDNPLGGTIALTLLLLFFPTTAFLIAARHGFSFSAIVDLREGRVAVTEGVVRKTMVYLSNSKESLYYYRINRLRFPVSEAGYDALIANRPYRVYYLPRSKILLSLEPQPFKLNPGGCFEQLFS
jgi:hypothetical protein